VENVVAISINHRAPEHVVLQNLAGSQASQTAPDDQATAAAGAAAEADPAAETPSPLSDQVTAHPGLVALANGSSQSGVGGLVKPDLDGEAARLQALQLQQQLSTLTAPIANQAPQALLALLR
jgi:flagellin